MNNCKNLSTRKVLYFITVVPIIVLFMVCLFYLDDHTSLRLWLDSNGWHKIIFSIPILAFWAWFLIFMAKKFDIPY